MRPYRILDEAPDEDDEYPGVVRIGAGGRSRSSGLSGGPRYQPWTPRDMSLPAAPPRVVESPPPFQQSGLTRTHQLMIASVAIICLGMLLGVLLVRVWDDASRAVAERSPEDSAQSASATGPATAPDQPAGPTAPAPEPPAAEPGAVTTEIRVLQPNYTVAPGDTLGRIAQRHGTTVEALASINNLENRNSLRVGQKLIIP